MVDTPEHLHHVLGEVEDRRDNKDAEEKVDKEGTLVEDANEVLVLPLATDLVGESDIQTTDQQVAEHEGEDSCHAHPHSDEGTIAATPPQVYYNNSVAEDLADGCGQDGTE
jgi:hypothetical protein